AVFDCAAPSPDGSDFVDRLARIDAAHPDPEALLEAYLTQTDRKARSRLLKVAVERRIPDIAERLKQEATRLEGLCKRLTAARLVARSDALLDVVLAIAERYDARKRARSLL